MRNVFDAEKNDANVAKHGISLQAADDFEWDSMFEEADVRQAYGEERFFGVGYLGRRLYYVVFTYREGERRIISLRKANIREVKRYAET